MAKKKETEIHEIDFKEWLESLRDFKLPQVSELPALDLYMDQVLTYISSKLVPLVEDKNYLTAAMINNYVKGHVIKAPTAKKYDADDLTQLLFISSVKQVLSIKEIKEIIDNDILSHYDQLVEFQSRTINNTIDNIKASMGEEPSKEILYTIALKFAIEAEIKKIIVSKIMEEVK